MLESIKIIIRMNLNLQNLSSLKSNWKIIKLNIKMSSKKKIIKRNMSNMQKIMVNDLCLTLVSFIKRLIFSNEKVKSKMKSFSSVSSDHLLNKISSVFVHYQVGAICNESSYETYHHSLLKTFLLPALSSNHGFDVLTLSTLNICLKCVKRICP